MRELALDELLRDHADHLAAGRERRVGDGAHQPDPAAAVDEAEPAARRSRAERARRLGIGGRRPLEAPQKTQTRRTARAYRAFSTVAACRVRFAARPASRPSGRPTPRCAARTCAGSPALFRGYRLRLGAVLGLILVSAALGVVPAFLLRGVLQAIQEHDTTQLSLYAGGMIAIAIVTGVLGVWQTLLSNQVGQRVMHDLRTAVFRHLQRLSLAFFTRTRTGEVQSRISNDIGGVQNVVTSTATSIVSNVTTVIATMIGMIALSWQLVAVRVRAGPGVRAADAPRRRRAAQDREVDAGDARRHLEPRPGVAVGLRDPARQDDGPVATSSPTGSSASRSCSPTSRCASGWPAAG